MTLKMEPNQSQEQSKHLYIYGWQNSKQTEIIKFAILNKRISHAISTESQSMH